METLSALECAYHDAKPSRHKLDIVANAVVKSGNLDDIAWLSRQSDIDATSLCCMAAENGNLQALKWLHEHTDAQLHHTLFLDAVFALDKDMFDYAIRENCPWDPQAGIIAMAMGHADAVQWILDAGLPFDFEYACGVACLNGHMHVFPKFAKVLTYDGWLFALYGAMHRAVTRCDQVPLLSVLSRVQFKPRDMCIKDAWSQVVTYYGVFGIKSSQADVERILSEYGFR